MPPVDFELEPGTRSQLSALSEQPVLWFPSRLELNPVSVLEAGSKRESKPALDFESEAQRGSSCQHDVESAHESELELESARSADLELQPELPLEPQTEPLPYFE
jgi:hypothetical protein